ncbi:MAG: hypothetical protein [Caudoviricetes sp.]|nr:MAG: hypothetical protein [Caudoviricetes sp.]
MAKRSYRKVMERSKFEKYIKGFEETKKAIGVTMKIIPYRGAMDIREHKYYILRGVLAYTADMNTKDGKIHIVFEDGTHVYMLEDSFMIGVYSQGGVVSVMEPNILDF